MERKRLLCLPYAGGSAASIYLPWKRKLKNYVEVIPCELAGRGNRIREPLMHSVDEIVNDLLEQTRTLIHEKKPYSIFGHSMGGLLAFEFCRKIHELRLPPPENLIVSAFQPPHIRLNGDVHLLPVDEFAQKMRRTGNIPESIFTEKHLYNFFIPVLYADYKLVFQYEYDINKGKISNNLFHFTGRNDYNVYLHRKEWSEHTGSYFEDVVFEGGHFFIKESEKEVLDKILSIMKQEKFISN